MCLNKKGMKQIVTIKDRQFEKFIDFEDIHDAIKKVAQDRKVPKNEVYGIYHNINGGD